MKADSTALAEVNCLETGQGRLWGGTPHGVRVFDGGAWDLIDTTDFLFDQNVTAIERGKKFVYFGTANSGLFAYYDGALSPLDWSENLRVTSLDIDNGRYLVGLQGEGAVLKTAEAQIDIPALLQQLSGLAVVF